MLTDVCPSCGSGKVLHQGTKASCTSCGWKGARDDLLAVVLDADSPDAALSVAMQVSQALLYLLREHAAQGIGQAIVQAGVVDVKDTHALTSLIRAGSLGAHRAILEEAERLGEAAQKGDAGEGN